MISLAPQQIRPYGSCGYLIDLAGTDQARSLADTLREHPLPGQVDLVPGATSVLIRLDTAVAPEVIAHHCAEVKPVPPQEVCARSLTLPVRYEGPDLAEVAELTGLTVPEVIAEHTGQLWTVAFVGFCPGFGYLTGQRGTLTVPRRAAPRPRVPPGAVGLAGEFSGIYPRASPGGWQLIGTCAVTLFDPNSAEPALLQPGRTVRFIQEQP